MTYIYYRLTDIQTQIQTDPNYIAIKKFVTIFFTFYCNILLFGISRLAGISNQPSSRYPASQICIRPNPFMVSVVAQW